VQSGFVDSPRDVVEQADALVGEVMDQFAAQFKETRGSLEAQWGRTLTRTATAAAPQSWGRRGRLTCPVASERIETRTEGQNLAAVVESLVLSVR
jgi:hypothetical protein